MSYDSPYTAGDVLYHFVGRSKNEHEQYEILKKVLREGLVSHPPHSKNISGNVQINLSKSISSNDMVVPQVVCFCDIPLGSIGIHIAKYSAFGVGLSRRVLIASGAAPVIYAPLGPPVPEPKVPPGLPQSLVEETRRLSLRYYRPLMQAHMRGLDYDACIHDMNNVMQTIMFQAVGGKDGKERDAVRRLQEAARRLQDFFVMRVWSFIKCFDEKLPADHPENYYMEREWRVVGNVKFTPSDVMTIVVPTRFQAQVDADLPEFRDKVHPIAV